MSKNYWHIYQLKVLSGDISPLLTLTLENLAKDKPRRRRMGFAPTVKTDIGYESRLYVEKLLTELSNGNELSSKKEKIMEDFKLIKDVEQVIQTLKKLTKDMYRYTGVIEGGEYKSYLTKAFSHSSPSQQERDLFDLGLVLIESGKWGDSGLAEKFIEAGFPINFQHPYSKKTLLHVALTGQGEGLSRLANTLIDSGKCDYLLKDNIGQMAYDLSYRWGLDLALCEKLYEVTRKQAADQNIEPDFKYGHGDFPKFDFD